MSWLHASDSLLHLSACGVCTGHIRESRFKRVQGLWIRVQGLGFGD